MANSEPSPSVLYHVDGAVGLVTLSRPSALNAINNAVRRELYSVVQAASTDPAVRVILFRGSGKKAFCAGADIKEFQATASAVATRAVNQSPKWTDAIAAAAKPTVAVIHGYCLGGGLEIALACDVRIASTDAAFGLPEVKLGLIPGAGGTQRAS